MRVELTIISEVGVKNLEFEAPNSANILYIVEKAKYFCRIYAFDSLETCWVLKPHYNEDNEMETCENIDLTSYLIK